jgi:hypothetical protein
MFLCDDISIGFQQITSLKIKRILIVEEAEVAAETLVEEEDLVAVEHLQGT